LSTRRKVAFACVTFLLVGMLAVATLFAADVYVHYRVQRLDLNFWGYRGPSVGRKKTGESRVVALGGSTVFGYGLSWTEAWPHRLESRINAARAGNAPARVLNLGVPRDSATTFVATLQDYAYLKPDAVILYEGYNDLELPGPKDRINEDAARYLSLRHQSPVFRWTGYLPLLPLVLNEKAQSLMHGGNLNAAYDSRQIVFEPGLATRVTAGAMKATADLQLAVERRFGRLTDNREPATAYDTACGRWASYCGAMREAIRDARHRGLAVVVVTQPYLSDLHIDQQQALAADVKREFGSDSHVRYVNLGRLIDLHDSALCYDGVHLTPAGNERIAVELAPVVREVIR
jgi:lysophospholipase L1-like esterase